MDISYITNTRGGLNVGFRNQALGVIEAMQSIATRTGKPPVIHVHPYDISELPALADTLVRQDPSVPHIVIAVADDGVEALRKLPPALHYTSLLIGHEFPRHAETIPEKISLLAVPEHVTYCPAINGVKCIRTPGVAHTLTAAKARDAIQGLRRELPVQKGQPVIAVMLGGTIDGKDYTPEEAYQFGTYVGEKAKAMGAFVLTTHSVRTQAAAIAAFNQALEESGAHGLCMPFKAGQEDRYQAFVGIVAENPQSLAFVTGDSVNMSCELASVVHPSQLFMYPLSNLDVNAQNREFVEWMHRTGRANIVEYIPQKHAHEVRPRVNTLPAPLDAAHQIASALIAHLNRPGTQRAAPSGWAK